MDLYLNSCVRGYHIYKEIWTPTINEELQCQRESGNIHAVAIVKDKVVVGHIPRKISTLCSSFIRRGGLIICKVVGDRRSSSDLIQGGLEIPCSLTFTYANDREIKKVKKLLVDHVQVVMQAPEPTQHVSMNQHKKIQN